MDENFLFLYSSFDLLLISFIVHSSMVDIFSINATTYLHFYGLRIHIITQTAFTKFVLANMLFAIYKDLYEQYVVETDQDIQPNLFPYPISQKEMSRANRNFLNTHELFPQESQVARFHLGLLCLLLYNYLHLPK